MKKDWKTWVKLVVICKIFSCIVIAIIIANMSPDPVPQPVIQNNVRTGSVWLGIQIMPVNKEVAKNFNLPYRRGLLVKKVINDSPADKGGLREGDVIMTVKNTSIINIQQLQSLITEMVPGQKIRVDVGRYGISKTLHVQLETRPAAMVKSNVQLMHGVYPLTMPPTDQPYPYFYFGEEPEKPENESYER